MTQDVQETPRLVRMCDSCGGVDDHPRHIHGVLSGQSPTRPEIAERALKLAGEENRGKILSQILDTATQVKHLDCCASDGCPDGSCNAIHAASPSTSDGSDPANADDTLRGEELLNYLTSGEADSVGAELNARRTTFAQVDAESQAEDLYENEEN